MEMEKMIKEKKVMGMEKDFPFILEVDLRGRRGLRRFLSVLGTKFRSSK